MSTPDGKLPGEAGLVSHSPADFQSKSPPAPPTPGAGMAVTRIPSGPTVPDIDPATLSLVFMRISQDNAMPGEATSTPMTGSPTQQSVSSPPGGLGIPSSASPSVPQSSGAPGGPLNPF